jgi:predicted transcriptional regulator
MDDQFTEDVKRLREQKLSERKIAEELKVSRSKVHDTLQKIQQAETIAALLSEDKMRSIIREELKLAHYSEEEDKEKVNGQFPVMRKMGGGMEVIAPEAVLRQYMGGTPEGELELRAIMKFRAAMLMVMDLVNIQKGSAEADAERMTPILRLMKETREEQDAAAHRAKESNVAIANQAAFETATQLSQVISQNNARITDSINQIRQAMGGKEENPLGQVLNSIQSMQQMMQMFGISMPGMPGLQGGVPPAQQWQPPPIIRRKRNESQGGEDVRSATTDDGNPPSP